MTRRVKGWPGGWVVGLVAGVWCGGGWCVVVWWWGQGAGWWSLGGRGG